MFLHVVVRCYTLKHIVVGVAQVFELGGVQVHARRHLFSGAVTNVFDNKLINDGGGDGATGQIERINRLV